MSIQIATAPGALVALGLGAGDVASIISLGKRVGNWWTGPSGDADLLELLDLNEASILHRRGLIDPLIFNKRWRKQIQLLANGKPITIEEADMEKVLGNVTELIQNLSLFTGIMSCLVAVLEQFADRRVAESLLRNVLKYLLKPSDAGEDILRSQYSSRLNAWRSTACLRGMNNCANKHRLELIDVGIIVPGHTPPSESKHIEEFLQWLLGTNEAEFHTASSDVAGIAFCLEKLGIDILQVRGRGFANWDEGNCTVLYSDEQFFHGSISPLERGIFMMGRPSVITVPLKHPWETVSVYPISVEVQNRCRCAWEEGKKAAKSVRIGVLKPDNSFTPNPCSEDIKYAIFNAGNKVERESPYTNTLAKNFSLVMNREFLRGLHVSLDSISNDNLNWLNDTIEGDKWKITRDALNISDRHMTDEAKIDHFCIFQSFLMGYYYSVFGRLVDTSTLVSDTVEGSWGYRSPGLLRYMRFLWEGAPSAENTPRLKIISRQRLLPVLTRLFLGTEVDVPRIELDYNHSKPTACMGVIGKRALLINSLLGKCSSPCEIGGFSLLDVDVGGIPRDESGLIRPGLADATLIGTKQVTLASRRCIERSPDQDISFNIEADWEGNPDKALICARYKGRRISTLSPASTDYSFCASWVAPRQSQNASRRSALASGAEVSLEDVMQTNALLPVPCTTTPVLFQAFDRPCLRYLAEALYEDKAHCWLATDCVQNAAVRAESARQSAGYYEGRNHIIIAGMSHILDKYRPTILDCSSSEAQSEMHIFEIFGLLK